MVISSIDLQDGKAVQLRQGKELALWRDNPEELAEEFSLYGETAIIDLDAAMGKPQESNAALIKRILRKAECRLGGGIRTPEQAREMVSLGAKKIIIGSSAFRDPAKKGTGFGLNVPLLEAFARAIGREKLIIAVDALSGEILVDGWKTPTGLDLIETASAAEPWASELLFTCVEREGAMNGIDIAQVKVLREAVSCNLTVAGGVSTLEEVEELSSLGCDIQLGMALYTGKITLSDAFVRSLNWEKGRSIVAGPPQQPLLPVIAQSVDGQTLMTGFTDREALEETFKRGNLCFHSRTRNKLWMKGENSGSTLKVKRLRADCDHDAILAVVEPQGPVCHTGGWSCFSTGRRYTWEYLQEIIRDRFSNPVPGSYTATLDDKLVREKIMEEAEEVCTAANHDEMVWEAADLLYFTTVIMSRAGVSVEEVLAELERRHLK